MSEDAFGFPRHRVLETSRDPSLSGQALIAGAIPLMDRYLCWARTDQVTASAAVTPYLLFDTEALPPGSVIRIVGSGNLTSNAANTGVILLATASDWLVSGGLALTNYAQSGDFTATTVSGQFHILVVIRTKTTALGSFGFIALNTQGGAQTNVSAVDHAKRLRWGLYCTNAGGGSSISAAFVEAFIPRVYR